MSFQFHFSFFRSFFLFIVCSSILLISVFSLPLPNPQQVKQTTTTTTATIKTTKPKPVAVGPIHIDLSNRQDGEALLIIPTTEAVPDIGPELDSGEGPTETDEDVTSAPFIPKRPNEGEGETMSEEEFEMLESMGPTIEPTVEPKIIPTVEPTVEETIEPSPESEIPVAASDDDFEPTDTPIATEEAIGPGGPGEPQGLFPPPAIPSGRPPGQRTRCFPSDGIVKTKNRGKLRMDELRIGDMVHVGYDRYEEVYLFTHQDPKYISEFVRITTKENKMIELSPGHIIMVGNDERKKARNVNLMDVLINENGNQVDILSIERIVKRGLYNPHTKNGIIDVNGLLSTVYTEAFDEVQAHALLSPIRGLYEMSGISMTNVVNLWFSSYFSLSRI